MNSTHEYVRSRDRPKGDGLNFEAYWFKNMRAPFSLSAGTGPLALPGCLIVSLVAVLLARGGPDEWIGAAIALGVAFATRNFPVTMVVGIVVVWGMRTYL